MLAWIGRPSAARRLAVLSSSSSSSTPLSSSSSTPLGVSRSRVSSSTPDHPPHTTTNNGPANNNLDGSGVVMVAVAAATAAVTTTLWKSDPPHHSSSLTTTTSTSLSSSSSLVSRTQCDNRPHTEQDLPLKLDPPDVDDDSSSSITNTNKESGAPSLPPNETTTTTTTTVQPARAGMQSTATGLYHGLFPQRQKWHPKVDYPLWDSNWDGQKPAASGTGKNDPLDSKRQRYIRKHGVTRHILLVRHGQYDETHKEDHLRVLTPLGKRQAELTGERLARLMEHPLDVPTTTTTKLCRITKLRVSNMTRAIETADIIAKYLPKTVHYESPDPLLNEGRPCHHIPGGKVSERVIQATDENHARIEQAFQKYFYRAPPPTLPQSLQQAAAANPQEPDNGNSRTSTTTTNQDNKDKPNTHDNNHPTPVAQEKPTHADDDRDEDHHEFEIIVCHANVIRYFLCRALQLPPEVWLRYCPFNCSLTYITIRPTGSVSCRFMGDVGHLPYASMTTFSQHDGFVW